MTSKTFRTISAARTFARTAIPGFFFVSDDGKTIVWFAQTMLPPFHKIATHKATAGKQGKVVPAAEL